MTEWDTPEKIRELNRFYSHVFTPLREIIRDTEAHLDYGCGNGLMTSVMLNRPRRNRVTGYDIDPDIIKKARSTSYTQGVNFTTSLGRDTYETATCLYVLHETDPEKAIMDIRSRLQPGGKICVVDYNMTSASLDEFLELFIGDQEMAELASRGEEETYRAHTSRGLEEYTPLFKHAGLIEIESWSDDKLFRWVGQTPTDTPTQPL